MMLESDDDEDVLKEKKFFSQETQTFILAYQIVGRDVFRFLKENFRKF